MAQSTFGSIVSVAAIGGLAWWAYEHFFASPVPAVSPAPSPSPAPAASTPAATPNPNPSPGPCTGAGVLAPLLAAVRAAQGNNYGENLPGTLTIDEWDFYLNRLCTGMADQFGVNADTLFAGRDDRGGPLNWNAFAGYARQRGLSELIPVDPLVRVQPFPVPPVRRRRPLPLFPAQAKGRAIGRGRGPQGIRLIGTELVRRQA